jgi:pyruvate formate lyase activating enzyme
VILENLKKLVKEGVNVVVRIPVIPELTLNGNNIENILKFVSSLERIQYVHLLPYHKLGKSKYKHSGRDYDLETIEPPDGSVMEKLAEKARQLGLHCIIGG